MNPLDWRGPQFLLAYVPFLIAMFILAKVWQRALRQPSSTPLSHELRLDPYQVALLHHREAALAAAVAALVHDKVLRFVDGLLSVADEPPPDAAPFECAVHATVSRKKTASFAELKESLGAEFEAREERLRHQGFLMSPEQTDRCRLYPMVLFGAALGLGVLKMLAGISRDRPVLFLVVLLVLGVVVGVTILPVVPRRTQRGDKALEQLRERNASLRTTARAEGSRETLSGANMAMAVALFGGGMLMTEELSDLRSHLAPSVGSDDGFDSHSGGDSWGDVGGSGGDGGDSGGSGCGGGGGCGGCGGD